MGNGKCRECNPTRLFKDCDCTVGHYCVSYPQDPKIGTCRKYESDIVGRQCNSNLESRGLDTLLGANDTMFCGLVVYNADLTANMVEWEGSCQRGQCEMCSTSPIPTAPITYCSDGRVCVNNKFTYAPSGIFSWSFFFINPLLLSFYIVVGMVVVAIAVAGYGVVAYTFYQRKYF